MRILHVEPLRYEQDVRDIIAAVGKVDYVCCAQQSDLPAALGKDEYRALFVRLGLSVDAEAFEAAPALRWVVTPTTGRDHIDLAEASRRKIEVISLKGETEFLRSVKSTAEQTWALLLALIRKLPAAFQDVLAGNWRREPFLGDELYGKTLGIIGCGRLGSMTAGYGLAFGMKVLAYDIDPGQADNAPDPVRFCELDELLSSSDVICLHLPLNDKTAGFMSAEMFERVRPDAFFVNTARGELVDETALLDTLQTGRLAGAAVDVISDDSKWSDSVPDDNPMVRYAREHDNLIISPHIGGYGKVSIARTRRFIAEKFVWAVKATV